MSHTSGGVRSCRGVPASRGRAAPAERSRGTDAPCPDWPTATRPPTRDMGRGHGRQRRRSVRARADGAVAAGPPEPAPTAARVHRRSSPWRRPTRTREPLSRAQNTGDHKAESGDVVTGRTAARASAARRLDAEAARRVSAGGHSRPKTQKSWRRPIFPKGCPLSIFGAGELNFRVRDGNGCGLSASVTRISCGIVVLGCVLRRASATGRRRISTSRSSLTIRQP